MTFRRIVLERFDMSLGCRTRQLKGRVFRIGHLGSFNDLMLAGDAAGVEMGLGAAGVPHRRGGVQAASTACVKQLRPTRSRGPVLIVGRPSGGKPGQAETGCNVIHDEEVKNVDDGSNGKVT